MRHLCKRLTVLACLLLFSCGTPTVSYRVIDRGAVSAESAASPRFRIISESAAFTETFQSLHAAELPQPKPPEVDFAQSAVLIVSLGQKPSAGNQVDVEHIQQQKGVLNVQLRVSKPPPTSSQATVMTSPFIVIEVAKKPGWKTVKFFDQEQHLLASLNPSN